MSKDIRSYFQKKPQKPKIDDDEDVIPESPDVKIKNKKKEVKKRRIVDDDSDEEIFSTRKKKSEKPEASKKSKDKSNKAPLKEVKAIDIFGSAPIKRTEPIVKKQKKNTEIGIHSDEEFEKSLLEIDNVELEDKSVNNQSKTDDTSHTDIKKPLTSNATKESTKSNSDSTKDKKHKHTKESESKTDKKTNHDKINTESDKIDKKKSEKNDKRSKTKVDDDDKRYDKRSDSEETNNIKKDSHKAVKTDKKAHQSTSDYMTSNGDKKSKTDNSKRKFAEFIETSNHDSESSKKKKLNESHESKTCDSKKIEADSSIIDSSFVEDDEKKEKKKRHNKSLNESALTDEERHERRIQSAALYKSYLNRSGPKHLGAKEIPEGTPDCLKDCAFVVTGVLDSFEKDEITAAINKFGGSVKSGVTKKVTHVLAGEDAGPKKMATAQELGIKIINEDEFLQMIKDLSNKKSHDKLHKSDTKKDKSPSKKSKDKDSHSNRSEKDRKGNHVDDKAKKNAVHEKIKTESKSSKDTKISNSSGSHKNLNKSNSPKKVQLETKDEPSTEIKSEEISTSSNQVNGLSAEDDAKKANTLMWVEKYKPQNIKQIIGQHGDASNVKKLMNWLTKWYVNRKAKLTKPSPWAKNDDGAFFKAALLSGPPGVGKTTTVGLVCKELGFDMVEFNASDTRNKTLIKEQIGELLTTTSLSGYAQGKTGKQAVTKKHVLVMDEVDGMAGNEDRGGLQELIGLIKSTSVPIICMCNDRNSQKMRSLANYTYDLRFSRPRVDQIKSAMMSICFKEGIKIPHDVLAQLISSANQDVRQTLNLLSMWAVEPSLADADRLRADAKTSKKDVKLGPWEAIRKVFSAEDHKTMSIHDKSDLFFYDYSLAPLFVQENYLQVAPHCPKHEVLQRISEAADSISLGDLVEARIRGSQAWSLLPLQAMYSSVIPGHAMSGHVTSQIQFPGWLGKNSRRNKMHRLCQEIHAHTRLSTSGSKSSIFLDYSYHLRDAITTPLIKDKMDGISQALDVLESYHLLREDLDSLVELSVWPGQRSPTVLIDSKVKAAMTRTYNKKATALPYAPGAVKKGRAKEDSEDVEEEPDTEEPDDSDPENDALIKKNKSKDTEKASTSKAEKSSTKASTSKKKKEK